MIIDAFECEWIDEIAFDVLVRFRVARLCEDPDRLQWRLGVLRDPLGPDQKRRVEADAKLDVFVARRVKMEFAIVFHHLFFPVSDTPDFFFLG